jgi:chemotaxis protein CheX
MLGEAHQELNGDVNDAVGEITNMISGVARKHMEAEGLNVVAAIPTVVSGKSHAILHVLGGPSVIIPFSTPDGDFFVDVCMSESIGEK